MTRVMWTAVAVVVVASGCAIFRSGDIEVGVIEPVGSEKGSDVEKTPYAHALQRVIHQQTKVSTEFRKRDWDEVLEESDEWLEDIRDLAGYASTSHDPAKFRKYCDQLIESVEGVRRSARARSVEQCSKDLDACDPILNNMSRDFPQARADVPPPPKRVRTEQAP